MLPSAVPPIPLTSDGAAFFAAEAIRLQRERSEAQERVTVAREMGDLSENGAYHYGKMELASYSRQLRHVQFVLKYGVVTVPSGNESVQFGHRVRIVADGKESTYTLVSNYESDPVKGKLSIDSPIGQALLGKKVGESIDVTTPSGVRHYQLIAID